MQDNLIICSACYYPTIPGKAEGRNPQVRNHSGCTAILLFEQPEKKQIDLVEKEILLTRGPIKNKKYVTNRF